MTETKIASADLAGKYLTFRVSEEDYGIQILKVQEIIRLQSITKVPKAPDSVRGVINLRGKVIPVMQLRKKFGLPEVDDTERTCIIVVQIGREGKNTTMGIMIDEVKEVVDIRAENIEETPSFGENINIDFILGIGKINDRLKILIDIDKVMSNKEIIDISQIAKAA
jgi:purine-binding chemotaxis protein CheW